MQAVYVTSIWVFLRLPAMLRCATLLCPIYSFTLGFSRWWGRVEGQSIFRQTIRRFKCFVRAQGQERVSFLFTMILTVCSSTIRQTFQVLEARAMTLFAILCGIVKLGCRKSIKSVLMTEHCSCYSSFHRKPGYILQ